DACSNAWGGYVNNSLRNLITKGKGRPNRKEQVATKKKTVKAKPIGKKYRKKWLSEASRVVHRNFIRTQQPPWLLQDDEMRLNGSKIRVCKIPSSERSG